jgi:hypothetical protein
MSSNTFSAQEFLERLGQEGADLTGPLVVSGMAREVEGSSSELGLVAGTRCADWTTVPADVVESVEVRGSMPCGDHTHPLVRVTFKEPQSAEAAAYASLLRARTREGAATRRVVSRPMGGSAPSGCGCGTPVAARHGLCDFNEVEIDANGTVWVLVSVDQQGDACIGTYVMG